MREDSDAPVFLTGATGFIGGRLAAALDARGRRLRCLVRAPERAGALARLGAELVVGDVTDADVMARGLEGAAAAVHLAAHYEMAGVDATAMRLANVEGTRVFLAACRAARVPRAVHVSSTAALGPVPAGTEGDGNSTWDGPFPSEYHRTKTEAHRLAQAAQSAGEPVLIACPAFVYGPGDEGPAALYMEDVLRHRVPGLSSRPGHFSYVHVDDVVAGLVAVLERGQPGATYVLGGENRDVNSYTAMIGRIAGTWVPPLRFPPFMVVLTGRAMDALSRVTGRRLPISAELARVGGTGQCWLHSSRRAERELGYTFRPLAEGLPDAVMDLKARLEG
jgi:nucleoside-diphosphate-sugar epimerase